MCYLSPMNNPQPPPPAGSDPESGGWYFCVSPPPFAGSGSMVWIEGQAVPNWMSPEELARQAIASMNLNPIQIGIAPRQNGMGLVGLPTWMWVANPSPNTYGPITASASDGPISVSATGNVESVEWKMGDGSTVSCGQGTPYADHYGKRDSPTCGHRYAQTSGGQPQNAYSVTATSHWVITWAGGGMTGTVTLDQNQSAQVRIGEMQVLNQ